MNESREQLQASDRVGARAGQIVWGLAALVAGLCLQSIYHELAGWLPIAIATGCAIAAAFRPYEALLVTAAFLPIGAALFVATGSGRSNLDFFQALALAFVTGWAARRAVRPQPWLAGTAVRWSAGALLAIAFAASLVNAAVIATEQLGTPYVELFRTYVSGHYLINVNPFSAAMVFMEGIVLTLAAADLCANSPERRDRVLRMLVIGACAAAIFNMLRLVELSLRQPVPWRALLTYVATVRVNVQYGDVNAAASVFAMMLFVAAGFLPRAAVPALLSTGLMAAALWIAGSRTALVFALVTAAVAGAAIWRSRSAAKGWVRPALAMVLVLAAVAAAGWKLYPKGRNLGGNDALDFRMIMGRVALDFIEQEPVFGVGPGRFAVLTVHNQNAHNNFLQIGAELGVPALVLFVLLVVFALSAVWRSADRPGPSWGLLAGLSVYLLTCLAGHPLLVPGAAYPFWIALGLAASSTARSTRPGFVMRALATAGVIVLAVSLPWRLRAAANTAYVEHSTAGLSQWHAESDGSRYRWAAGRSTFFVPADAMAIRVPLRCGPGAPDGLDVRLLIDGRDADGIRLEADGSWRIARLVFVKRTGVRFTRIDVVAATPGASAPIDAPPSPRTAALAIGRVEIER